MNQAETSDCSKAVGWLVALSGGGVIFPAAVTLLELGAVNTAGIWMIILGLALIAGAVPLIRRPRVTPYPRGVRPAITAVVIFLVFFALEFSDRLVRQEGKIFYWNLFLHVPALALFIGLVRSRVWAWWTCRSVTFLGALWFLVFIAIIPFADIRKHGEPAPPLGRIYMATVSLAFAGILAGAFVSLGRPEARQFFGKRRRITGPFSSQQPT